MKITKIENGQCEYFRGRVVKTFACYFVYIDGFSIPFMFTFRPDFQIGYELTRDDIYEFGMQWAYERKELMIR